MIVKELIMALIVHHLNNSRSQRILWLLEELAIPYEIKFYERNKKTMLAPAELKKVHPLGKSPVITDGELVIAESGAIIDYLVTKYGEGRLRPGDKREVILYNYWLHYAEGSLMPFLLLVLIFNKVEENSPKLIRPITTKIAENVRKAFLSPNIKTHLEFLENHLTSHEWFAGRDFSAADIQMSFPLEAAGARKLLQHSPKLQRFLTTIHERSAYKKALEKGGPYSLLS